MNGLLNHLRKVQLLQIYTVLLYFRRVKLAEYRQIATNRQERIESVHTSCMKLTYIGIVET